MWSAIAGALGGAASAAGNSYLSYLTSSALAKQNYEYGQKSLRNSPSNYKEGLERAGLNPMLAASSGVVGSTSGGAAVNPGMDLADSASKGGSAKNLNAQTKSNMELQSKQGNAAEGQAAAAAVQAKAALMNAETNRMNSQSAIAKNVADTEYSQALRTTEDAIRDSKVLSEGKKGNNAIYNSLKDMVNMIPSEREDYNLFKSPSSAKSVNNSKPISQIADERGLKGEEKEKFILEQIRKNQKYIRSK